MKTNAEKALPVFAIIGLRYGQEAHVARRCGHLADLKFVQGDKSETALPASDAVFLMTKFIQHRWTTAAYQTFARERVHLHNGGISGLAAKIEVLAKTPTKQPFLWRKE